MVDKKNLKKFLIMVFKLNLKFVQRAIIGAIVSNLIMWFVASIGGKIVDSYSIYKKAQVEYSDVEKAHSKCDYRDSERGCNILREHMDSLMPLQKAWEHLRNNAKLCGDTTCFFLLTTILDSWGLRILLLLVFLTFCTNIYRYWYFHNQSLPFFVSNSKDRKAEKSKEE